VKSLQDKYLPKAEIRKTVTETIGAAPDRVYDELLRLDFSASRLTRLLFRLRGLPARRGQGIEDLLSFGFVKLEEIPKQGFILGLIGRFWTPTGHLARFKPDQFNILETHTQAKATWSFEVRNVNGTSVITTETRIQCPTRRIRRRFRLYWFFVQPFSTLIRREILKTLKREAEKPSRRERQ